MRSRAGQDGAGQVAGEQKGRGSRIQEMTEKWKQAQAQQASQPDGWMTRYFAVGMCVALLVYCFYVYAGRVCVPMIRGDATRRGGRVEGIVFLVFFVILWLLMSYTYAAIVLTGPGFARDHVSRCPCPEPPFPNHYLAQPAAPPAQHPDPSFQVTRRQNTTVSTLTDTAADTPEEYPSRPSTNATAVHPPPEAEHEDIASAHASKLAFGSGPARVLAGLDPTTKTTPSSREDGTDVAANGDSQPGQPMGIPGWGEGGGSELTVERQGRPSLANSYQSFLHFPDPPAAPEAAHTARSRQPERDGQMQGSRHRQENHAMGRVDPKVFRQPPLSAPLHPYFRWCSKCEHIKPPRTHHCRHCGTCVLCMDHHCPWIGQCVGARNHIYFVTFCFWSCIALGYIFITLLIATLSVGISPRPTVDPQTLVICAIAAVLSFFTGSMTITHWYFIAHNMSTIESFGVKEVQEGERARVHKEYDLREWRTKRRVLRELDREWGNLNTEANLWWRGSKRENWRLVMGPKVLAWILPPPKYCPDDGLSYQMNPRRGPDGLWRRRVDWPKELQ